jgi:tRNA nucleotidyltransferase (CCA-adding enzyme)
MTEAEEGGGRRELFPHQADWGVRGVGRTPAEAFEQAALAMTEILVDPARVECREEVSIAREAADLEALLVDWLSAVIYEMAVRRMVFGRFEVRIEGRTLAARAWGEPVDSDRHDLGTELKGATYTSLSVRRCEDGNWLAQCVVDV